MFLYALDSVFEGCILSRPSRKCKSPYVADVRINEFDEELLAHAPSLGCGGLCQSNMNVIMTQVEDPKICDFTIQIAKINEKNNEILVGVNPKNAEKIVHRVLYLDLIQSLQHNSNITAEYKYGKSRFDFHLIDHNGIETFIEVKSVPLADYEDIEKKERKDKNYDHLEYDQKVSYFPDGYRKKKNDPVSPRALKHINELSQIKKERKDNVRCIMIYVIQRNDSKVFQPSIVDPIYRSAFIDAQDSGVEMIAIQTSWNKEGECFFEREMPINI